MRWALEEGPGVLPTGGWQPRHQGQSGALPVGVPGKDTDGRLSPPESQVRGGQGGTMGLCPQMLPSSPAPSCSCPG